MHCRKSKGDWYTYAVLMDKQYVIEFQFDMISWGKHWIAYYSEARHTYVRFCTIHSTCLWVCALYIPWDHLYIFYIFSSIIFSEEIELLPLLRVAPADPNVLRGNIRLPNSGTRSPAVTIYCHFCRRLHPCCHWFSWLLYWGNVSVNVTCKARWDWHLLLPLDS